MKALNHSELYKVSQIMPSNSYSFRRNVLITCLICPPICIDALFHDVFNIAGYELSSQRMISELRIGKEAKNESRCPFCGLRFECLTSQTQSRFQSSLARRSIVIRYYVTYVIVVDEQPKRNALA